MDHELQEDWLDQRLRDEAPYIDDAGFTANVLQKLPAPQRQPSYRAAILLCFTLLASGLAYRISDGGRFLVVEAYRFAGMPLLVVSLVAVAVTLVMTAVAAGAAWTNARERL
ncbi:MAG: hypothetical protein ACR2G0_06585 [Chthoniobacterales bacterium]